MMKIYEVEFEGMWPVGNCLIIAALSKRDATAIAKSTITHTDKFEVKEVKLDYPKVIVYLDGNY